MACALGSLARRAANAANGTTANGVTVSAGGAVPQVYFHPSRPGEAAADAGVSGRPRLIGIHIRAQDSTHNTHVADKGEASRKKLEGAVQQCARRRMAAAAADVVAAACGSTACTARTAVAIFVASDHMGLKRQVLAELRSWPGVVAEGLSSIHGFRGDAASRGTAKGHEVAAIELAILAHADELIQAGNRAFSSYSLTAAGLNVHATRPTQYAIHHPCAEEFGGYFGDESDCMEQLHPQPWLNLRWPVEETPLEWRRVPCKLYDPTGAPKPLVSRLAAKGSMELRCHDLAAMAVSHGVWTNANAKPPPRTPAASAASAPAKPAHWKPRAQRERDEL